LQRDCISRFSDIGHINGHLNQRPAKTLVTEAAKANPKKEQLSVSGKGLIEAAKTAAEMAGPIVTAVKAVLGLFGVPVP
jgi:hypothetical protein